MNPIQEPLQYISTLFDQHVENGNTGEFDPSNKFLDILKENKSQIISLNEVTVQQQAKNNALVRFRCMIQDTGLGQEMFISAYEKLDPNGNTKLQCYRYTDAPIDSEVDLHSNNDYLQERTLVYCVSPPGETQWSRKAYNSNNEDEDLSQQLDQLQLNDTKSKKYPLPNTNHKSAIVKFYNDMGETVKVGQYIEVIGILGDNIQEGQDDFDSVLNQFTDVPVLHAIAYEPLSDAHPLPKQMDPILRESLLHYIASGVNGDLLTAEFILLQLLSRVHVKNRGLKIGNFTLNIQGFPSHQHTPEELKVRQLLDLNNPQSKQLATILDNLSIHTVNLPLTIDGLNKSKFSPKSINENLESGLLQLIDGTVLLIDETVLDEGQLVDPGVRNFQALNNLIQHQTLTFEFPYSQYDFDTDINVISLSNTKSMLPNHCSIQLMPNTTTTNEEPNKETLDRFRQFIHAAKYGAYDISENVSEYIQDAFVNERKLSTEQKTELPTQEELMLRMNLARLAAVSFGEPSLTQARYDYVVQLDKQRRARITTVEI